MANATPVEHDQDLYLEQFMHAARTDSRAHDLYMQEFIRDSMPDPPKASAPKVPPLRDDEIGKFYCGICMESCLVFDRFRAAAECAHEFCVGCIVRFIEVRVAQGAVPVRCPAPGCRDGVLHPEACKKLLDLDVFDAWCLALCENAVGPARVRCPYRDCGVLVSLEDGEVGDTAGGVAAAAEARCPGCLRAFCVQCEEPWDDRHSGGGAEGGGCALVQLAESRRWRRCPSCRAMIDLIEGCKCMICRCGCVFCYGCGSTSSGSRELGCRCNSELSISGLIIPPIPPTNPK